MHLITNTRSEHHPSLGGLSLLGCHLRAINGREQLRETESYLKKHVLMVLLKDKADNALYFSAHLGINAQQIECFRTIMALSSKQWVSGWHTSWEEAIKVPIRTVSLLSVH